MPHIKEQHETKRWVESQTGVIKMCPEIRFGEEFITRMPKQKDIDNGIIDNFVMKSLVTYTTTQNY